MARFLNLAFENKEVKYTIQKLDRKKLYGYTIVDVKDDNGLKCELASISDDGKYILAKGCISYVYLNGRNEFVEKSEIQVVDKENNPLEKISSSFDLERIELVPGTMNDYFRLHVKAVYQLNEDDEDSLIDIVEKHDLLYFKFNYRTDYDFDDAFILQNEGELFMVIGRISPFEFVGLEQATEPAIANVEDDDDDDLDFGML